MKVLDLQCQHGHSFEGWFGSEDDFQNQLSAALVQCPLCGDGSVHKKLSAPRLNFGAGRDAVQAQTDTGNAINLGAACARSTGVSEDNDRSTPAGMQPMAHNPALQAAWLKVARRVLEQTEDVGTQFAQEARKIHYGEAKERGIRGEATRDQTLELLDEGINVLPLNLQIILKEPLH